MDHPQALGRGAGDLAGEPAGGWASKRGLTPGILQSQVSFPNLMPTNYIFIILYLMTMIWCILCQENGNS